MHEGKKRGEEGGKGKRHADACRSARRAPADGVLRRPSRRGEVRGNLLLWALSALREAHYCRPSQNPHPSYIVFRSVLCPVECLHHTLGGCRPSLHDEQVDGHTGFGVLEGACALTVSSFTAVQKKLWVGPGSKSCCIYVAFR
jgi:hypothetical protein